MTTGVGALQRVAQAVDTQPGFFVDYDLALYGLPVEADIPHQDIDCLDESDAMSSRMKAKAVGELGIPKLSPGLPAVA